MRLRRLAVGGRRGGKSLNMRALKEMAERDGKYVYEVRPEQCTRTPRYTFHPRPDWIERMFFAGIDPLRESWRVEGEWNVPS